MLYTGVDMEPEGMFQNEIKDAETERKIQDQERLLKELTPQLEDLIALIDAEIKEVMSIDRFTSAASQPESDIRSELQAAALYKKYLEQLKVRFALALQETKR